VPPGADRPPLSYATVAGGQKSGPKFTSVSRTSIAADVRRYLLQKKY